MDKKHPIPPLPTPVEKAIRQLMDEVQRRGSANIEGVIVHPSDLPTLGALITNKPLPKPSGKALTEAWKKHVDEMKNAPVYVGSPSGQVSLLGQPLAPHQVQTAVQAMSLEQQLEASLWELVESVEPATPESIAQHLPHLQGSSERIRRVLTTHVLVLCPCKSALQFNRCVWVDIAHERCDEEVPVVEGGYANCVLHRTHDPATGRPWLPNSRFYRCDYFDGSSPDGQCTGVATRTTADGRHWCAKEGHIA